MEKQKINWDDLRIVYNIEKRINSAIMYLEASSDSDYAIPILKKVLGVIDEERTNYFISLGGKT